MPWSSWSFRMTVGGFAKASMLGSVLSESLTDSTAFRKCLESSPLDNPHRSLIRV